MPKTVLIVEDDEDTRSIYGTAVSERGYRVLTATHGAEGVHLARRYRPDLILLDIRMPVMDGWQAMRYLKGDLQTRNIPICAISAYSVDDEERQAALRMEFDCVLAKPMDPREVVSEVERLIGPPDAGSAKPSVPTAE